MDTSRVDNDINRYYTLKRLYETNKKNKIALLPSQPRKVYSTLPREEQRKLIKETYDLDMGKSTYSDRMGRKRCINCGKLGGTVFKRTIEGLNTYLIAECGRSGSGGKCDLNVKILLPEMVRIPTEELRLKELLQQYEFSLKQQLLNLTFDLPESEIPHRWIKFFGQGIFVNHYGENITLDEIKTLETNEDLLSVSYEEKQNKIQSELKEVFDLLKILIHNKELKQNTQSRKLQKLNLQKKIYKQLEQYREDIKQYVKVYNDLQISHMGTMPSYTIENVRLSDSDYMNLSKLMKEIIKKFIDEIHPNIEELRRQMYRVYEIHEEEGTTIKQLIVRENTLEDEELKKSQGEVVAFQVSSNLKQAINKYMIRDDDDDKPLQKKNKKSTATATAKKTIKVPKKKTTTTPSATTKVSTTTTGPSTQPIKRTIKRTIPKLKVVSNLNK